MATFPTVATDFRDYAAALHGGGTLGGTALPPAYADLFLPPPSKVLDLQDMPVGRQQRKPPSDALELLTC